MVEPDWSPGNLAPETVLLAIVLRGFLIPQASHRRHFSVSQVTAMCFMIPMRACWGMKDVRLSDRWFSIVCLGFLLGSDPPKFPPPVLAETQAYGGVSYDSRGLIRLPELQLI